MFRKFINDSRCVLISMTFIGLALGCLNRNQFDLYIILIPLFVAAFITLFD